MRPDAAIGLRGVAAGTLMGDVRGQDYDGHVLRTAIDFGDGTVQTDRDSAACRDPGSAWAGSSFTAPVQHRPRPGDYGCG